MKVITRHESPDTLILIEIPILPGASARLPEEHDRLRARAQPLRREGVPAAVRSRRSRRTTRTSIAARRFRTCATSAATPSSSTGAWPKRSTPPIRNPSNSTRSDVFADPSLDHVAQARAALADAGGVRAARLPRHRPEPAPSAGRVGHGRRGAAHARSGAPALGHRLRRLVRFLRPAAADRGDVRVGRSPGSFSRALSVSTRFVCSTAGCRAASTPPRRSIESLVTSCGCLMRIPT